jgi:hypothetical protein
MEEDIVPLQRRLSVLLLVLAWPAVAGAQDRYGEPEPDPVFDSTIAISGSIGYSWTDSTLRLDASDDTPGTSLDGERDLGLDANEMSGQLEVVLRPRPRHRVRLALNYLPSDRSASQVTDRDIYFGDDVYVAGDEVRSKLRIRTWSAAYAYSFLRSPSAEVAVSLGVTSIDFYAEVEVPARSLKEIEERSLPAPQLGLEAAVRFNSRWYGEARYQYVRLNASSVSGSLGQLDASVAYQLHPNVALGLGYTRFVGDVRKEQSGDSGRLAYSSSGPQLFLRASF